MPEGTAASVWASPPPKDREPASKEPNANSSNNHRGQRGGGNTGKKRRGGGGGGGKKPAVTHTTADASDSPPRQKLIDRLSTAPDAPASPTAQPSAPTKTDSPDSKAQASRRNGGRGRGNSKKKGPPAKVNTAAAQKELEKENAKQVVDPEPEHAQEKEQEPEEPKDAPPHINGPNDTGGALTPNINGLADRLKALNPSAPTTPRPFTPSAIDWAGETEDGSLPDLDDWGVNAKSSSPTEDTKPQEKAATKPAPAVTETRPNDRQNRRKDSKAGRNLAVPNRNANSNASSRPVTPSSTGFASPALRGKQLPPRASSRASTLNEPPPQITVEKPSSGLGLGLGLDLAVEEPVFASINDPLPEPPSELHTHIKPVRTPNTHPNGRGRGRGGRPRMSDGHAQVQPGANPGFGISMPMHMPSSPHMPPSPHLPPSPYLPGTQLPPNAYHPGYGPGPFQGYPQPHSPGFVNNGPGFGHQYSHSHPQHSRPSHHHSPRNGHHHPNESPRHQRSSSRPVIAGTALSMLNRTLQGSTTPPPKSKADVSASS